jgi:lipoprotein-releasing system permease protein
MLEFDTRLAYTSIGALQRYLGLEDVVGGIQVRVADIEQARAVRDRLRALLGDSVRVSDWQELNSNLFSALKLEKIAMFLVLSINILLAAFAITATLVMTIIERRRQVAILSAMGAHPGGIVRIFMSQGLFNGALGAGVGAALGLSLGLGLSAVQLPMDGSVYYLPNIPVDVRVVDVAAIVLVALAISVLSTIYPAIYAARLRPVEGLSAE